MRLNAFAIQLKLESDASGKPAPITPFPFTFTLSDFVAWYWRVKTWQVEMTITGAFTVSGIPYTFTKVSSDTLSRVGGFSDEASGVQDTYQRAVNTDTAIPMSFLGASHSFRMFEVGSFPDTVRGYWTGSNGGIAGSVLPRFSYQNSFDIPDSEITPLGSGGITLNLRTFEAIAAGSFTAEGTETDGFSFFSHDTDCSWQIDHGGAALSAVSFSAFSIAITPSLYFEYSDGITPVWDSGTGAQLVTPLPQN